MFFQSASAISLLASFRLVLLTVVLSGIGKVPNPTGGSPRTATLTAKIDVSQPPYRRAADVLEGNLFRRATERRL